MMIFRISLWVWPPPSNSDHQDIVLVGDPYKTLQILKVGVFLTGMILGDPNKIPSFPGFHCDGMSAAH